MIQTSHKITLFDKNLIDLREKKKKNRTENKHQHHQIHSITNVLKSIHSLATSLYSFIFFFFASFITQLKQVFYGQLFVIIDRCLTFICDWENIENIGKKKKNSSRISNRSFLTSSLPFYE